MPLKAEKITFRLSPRYAEKLADVSKEANIGPNQFARIATMLVAQNGLMSLNGRMGMIEDTNIRILKMLSDVEQE